MLRQLSANTPTSFQSRAEIRRHGHRKCREVKEGDKQDQQGASQGEGEEQGGEGAGLQPAEGAGGNSLKISRDSPEHTGEWGRKLPQSLCYGGENQEDGGRGGPPPPALPQRKVCDILQQGQQQDPEEEGCGGPGQDCSTVCGRGAEQQAGGRGEGGRPNLLPSHQHWPGLQDGGPEAWVRLQQGGHGHQDWPGQGRHRLLHQLCPDSKEGFSLVRNPNVEESSKHQAHQILHRLRRLHLCGGRGGGQEGEGHFSLEEGGGQEGAGAGRSQEEGGCDQGGQWRELPLHHVCPGGEGQVRRPGVELVLQLISSLAFLIPIYGLAAALCRGGIFPLIKTLL